MTPQPEQSDGCEFHDIELVHNRSTDTAASKHVPNKQDPTIVVAFQGLKKVVTPSPPPPSLISSTPPGAQAPKEILSNVSGYANPGEVLALMGPSGSGKTTLLDCLSNRGGVAEGRITLNSAPLQKHHKRLMAYVTQEDLFFNHLTVFDQLLYTALLRLGGLTRKEKVAEVNKILAQLKLTKCRDTPIMLISGGEKKRTNIGSELLTDPSVGYNGADHIMDLLVVEEGHEDGRGDTVRRDLIDSWDNEGSKKMVEARVGEASAVLPPPEAGEKARSKWNVSYMTQLKVLTHRCMRNSRSAIFTPLNFIKSAGLGLISGFIWLDMAPTESWVDDRNGFIFFAVTFWTFDSMFTAMMSFPPERAIIFKERASGSYRLSSYFFAKTISEAPLRLTLPFTFLTISYWMAALNMSFSVFLSFMCVQLLCVLAGESVGLLIGATVMDAEKAMVTATLVSLSQMLSGGFFARRIGDGVRWDGAY
ncbi:hypothetical protein TrRE_jg13049 [Triparma retinervis]|uniref:ABC transporter domain-containing protein n=1 Tax=Triparma retinervis TaxID=2557542 RepID=A0A9W6ZQB8_9STRA|nr:hypothetical protein TrRE_jg13049 [Triparma retinervis]